MNRYFIHNQEYENALGKVNNKMKISFIGALKILEQSGYGLQGCGQQGRGLGIYRRRAVQSDQYSNHESEIEAKSAAVQYHACQ